MGRLNEILKGKAASLKKEITAIYYAYQNPEIGILPKIMIAVTLGYALSPIDLIPDFIPILGYLDDLIILPVFIILSLKLIPDEIMDICRKKALENPLQLRNNWFFAALFISVWIFIIALIVIAFLPDRA